MSPREVLRFVERATPELLKSRYCDVAFCRYLRVKHRGPDAFSLFEPAVGFEGCWLYYYCRTPGDNLSQTVRPDLAYARDHIDDLRAHCPGMPLENLAHFSGQWQSQLDLFCMIHATGVETVAAGQFLFGALSVLSQLASIGYGKPRGGSVLFWLGARTVPALLRRAVALGVLLDPPAAGPASAGRYRRSRSASGYASCARRRARRGSIDLGKLLLVVDDRPTRAYDRAYVHDTCNLSSNS